MRRPSLLLVLTFSFMAGVVLMVLDSVQPDVAAFFAAAVPSALVPVFVAVALQLALLLGALVVYFRIKANFPNGWQVRTLPQEAVSALRTTVPRVAKKNTAKKSQVNPARKAAVRGKVTVKAV